MEEYTTWLSTSTTNYVNASMEHNNVDINYTGSDSQYLSLIAEIFAKMNNKTFHNDSDDSYFTSLPIPSMIVKPLASSDNLGFPLRTNVKFYQIFPMVSLWFVLIANPIVILFGVVGNLLATYILIHCNIAKFTVSFYAVMLNISDTLNLLIPVFIFWIDNCVNRTSDYGYFRDRSNSLCKALMCLDQLFATLSAWYMCAISFNRWYSVCRPSSYFFRTTTSNISGSTNASTMNNRSSTNRLKKRQSSGSIIGQSSSFFILFCFPINMCSCFTRNIKFRQHLQAFRTIAGMTLIGILFCLYPIFLHEIQPYPLNRSYTSALKNTIISTQNTTWQRCYYNEKHEHAYNIVGIILSCFLHILPLTFVAAMNFMIIIRLKQRQYRMTIASSILQSQSLGRRSKSINTLRKKITHPLRSSSRKKDYYSKSNSIVSQSTLSINRKDQATSTDLSIQNPNLPNQASTRSNNIRTTRRHHSRDRTITIMLVSIALSYIILTLPYRVFWSYFVYIKRAHPGQLNSYMYLFKMHWIDHVLRTIRNIHYGTNFVFFIFLSKTFRRKFQQMFIERFLQVAGNLCHRNSTTLHTSCIVRAKDARQRQMNFKLERKGNITALFHDHGIEMESFSKSILDDTRGLYFDGCLQADDSITILGLQQNSPPKYDDA